LLPTRLEIAFHLDDIGRLLRHGPILRFNYSRFNDHR
jgi:hypothetical protein